LALFGQADQFGQLGLGIGDVHLHRRESLYLDQELVQSRPSVKRVLHGHGPRPAASGQGWQRGGGVDRPWRRAPYCRHGKKSKTLIVLIFGT
jgi:hypothetical protein